MVLFVVMLVAVAVGAGLCALLFATLDAEDRARTDLDVDSLTPTRAASDHLASAGR